MISPAAPTSIDTALLARFGTLMVLINRARQATTPEDLAFLAVNETHQLVPYRQGVLWFANGMGGRVAAISGQPLPDRDAPYAIWQSSLLAHLANLEKTVPLQITRADLPETLAAPWEEWLPEQGLWLPLFTARIDRPGGGCLGGCFWRGSRPGGRRSRPC